MKDVYAGFSLVCYNSFVLICAVRCMGWDFKFDCTIIESLCLLFYFSHKFINFIAGYDLKYSICDKPVLSAVQIYKQKKTNRPQTEALSNCMDVPASLILTSSLSGLN